jgi:hypothetical protein
MVAAYMQNSLYVEALALFLQLNLAGWQPDVFFRGIVSFIDYKLWFLQVS